MSSNHKRPSSASGGFLVGPHPVAVAADVQHGGVMEDNNLGEWWRSLLRRRSDEQREGDSKTD